MLGRIERERAFSERALRASPARSFPPGRPLPSLECTVQGVPRPLDPEVEAVVCRVTQEAIANVVKHAAARTVRLGLSYGARGVRLSVRDNGRGFTVDSDLHAYGGHWGLLGMHERASQIRAKLAVRSAAGQGTEVILVSPYRRHERSDPRPINRYPQPSRA